jgi:hypothetical protein
MNGPGVKGINNREIDRWTTTHTSNATPTSKSTGVQRITAQHIHMTSDTVCGIFNRLGNNEEDAADNEISPKNTFSTYRKNNKENLLPNALGKGPPALRDRKHLPVPKYHRARYGKRWRDTDRRHRRVSASRSSLRKPGRVMSYNKCSNQTKADILSPPGRPSWK